MQKTILFTSTVFLCSFICLSTPSFADQSSALITSTPGSFIGTTDTDARYPVDPQTGKRPGIIDWNGTGQDLSQHPHDARHDSKRCGICG